MADDSRPYIKMDDYNTLHLLMAQGVIEFGIQWAYTSDDLIASVGPPPTFEDVRWWPSTDPDGNGITGDSDFGVLNGMNRDQFGVFFGLPMAARNVDGIDWYPVQDCKTKGVYYFKDTFYPKALKFTFVLKDANRMFPEGKTFTHIVSLDK